MKFAVLDFETTGNQPGDRIIQVGLVVIEDNIIKETYTTVVNPEISVPPFITDLTGLTKDQLVAAPTLDEVVHEWLPLLNESVLVGHHVAFDLGYLQKALDECGYAPFAGRTIDTIDLLKMLYPGMPSMQLATVTAQFGLTHERPHQADSDALATAELLLQCLQKLKELPFITLQRLEQQLEEAAASLVDLAWLISECRLQRELHGNVEDEGDTQFYRQFALAVGEWSEETETIDSEKHPLEDESFAQFQEQMNAALAERFAQFEARPAQLEMMQHVHDALTESKHLMIEAGTGTGKSLGYLTPALHYALQSGEKVVVSTHTINLQEQLINRDIPLLQQSFPVPFKAALLKGRNHYLCLRKFEQKINRTDPGQSKEEALAAAQLLVWVGQTEHGDDEELHLTNKAKDLWQEVSSDTDSCLNRACPWFHRCYYHRAKHKANEADVIITNHAMLFTDMIAEHRLLPVYDKLVVDEAHHFEEVASHHLGRSLTYYNFLFALTKLYKDAQTGMLPSFIQRLRSEESEKSIDWSNVITETIPKFIELKEAWDDFSAILYDFIVKEASFSGSAESNQYVYRFRPKSTPKIWDQVKAVEDNIHALLTDVLKKMDPLLDDMKEHKDEFTFQSMLTDLSGAVRTLGLIRDDLRFFVAMPNEGFVYWMEAASTLPQKSIQLHAVPLDVSDLIREHFFEKIDSIILTSATISVNRSFAYAAGRFGIENYLETEQLKTVLLASPFNYRKQSLVIIPRDFPKIRGAAADPVFLETLVSSLASVAETTRGRMMVLFTSHRMLRQVHEELKPKLSQAGIEIIGQGIDSANRSKLTEWFRESEAGVLLGTSSFWEGVDIPGESLSCLAIVRLPFQPPYHPLMEARSEHMKKNKQNPFMDYAVPQAVIRFKQGFGRLIRQASDKGIVIVYDTRVLETHYGKNFLYSLPGPKIEHMMSHALIPRIEEWFEEETRGDSS